MVCRHSDEATDCESEVEVAVVCIWLQLPKVSSVGQTPMADLQTTPHSGSCYVNYVRDLVCISDQNCCEEERYIKSQASVLVCCMYQPSWNAACPIKMLGQNYLLCNQVK